MSPPNGNDFPKERLPLSTKDMLEYVWRPFQYHAGQRMQAFNFFLVLITALSIGYGKAFEVRWYWATMVIGLFGSLATVTFLALDRRNQNLIEIEKKALKEIESWPQFSPAWPPACQILLRQDEQRKAGTSHQRWLLIFYVSVLIGFVVAFAVSLTKLGCTY